MTDYTKTIPSLEISSTLEVSYSDSGQQHILCSLHSCSHNYNQKFEKNESFIRDAELLCYLRLCTVKMQNDRIKIISERSWIRTENLTENTWAFEKYYSQLLCLKCLLSTYINCLYLIETMWRIEMATLSAFENAYHLEMIQTQKGID